MSYLQMRERIVAALTGHPFEPRRARSRPVIDTRDKGGLMALAWEGGDFPDEIKLLEEPWPSEEGTTYLRTYKEKRISPDGVAEIAFVYREYNKEEA